MKKPWNTWLGRQGGLLSRPKELGKKASLFGSCTAPNLFLLPAECGLIIEIPLVIGLECGNGKAMEYMARSPRKAFL
jgi:hypothetical protein